MPGTPDQTVQIWWFYRFLAIFSRFWVLCQFSVPCAPDGFLPFSRFFSFSPRAALFDQRGAVGTSARFPGFTNKRACGFSSMVFACGNPFLAPGAVLLLLCLRFPSALSPDLLFFFLGWFFQVFPSFEPLSLFGFFLVCYRSACL